MDATTDVSAALRVPGSAAAPASSSAPSESGVAVVGVRNSS